MDRNQEMAQRLAAAVAEAGGRAYYVGGSVRDRLLGIPGKDLDLEIHGLAEERLFSLLAALGAPLAMGESYPVYGLRGYNLDISLPRSRSSGEWEPFLSPGAAAARRDFTVNALMEDVLSGALLDFYGGKQDIEHRILRHIQADTFREDPLRVLRCARFSATLGFSVASETSALCKSLSLENLPRERVFRELRRALMEAPKPSVFFTVLRDMEQLDCWFSPLNALIGIPQPPRYHGEGDAWNHTLMVLDQAAALKGYASDPLGFLLAALCHDYGKALCTTADERGIHAYGHETAGLPLVKDFLGKLTNQKGLLPYVQNLVKLHMRPNTLACNQASEKATNKLLDAAMDPEALLALAAADDMGRITESPHICHRDFWAERLSLYRKLMTAPSVGGRDLLEAGVNPGPAFSGYLQYARRLQLSGLKKEAALKQTLSYIQAQEQPGHKK